MHIENFKIFLDLVDGASFSRAAKINGITQSAVSQQLRAMEKHFDVLIVDRGQKQFRLTREGKALHDAAKEILSLYDRLNRDLQEMRQVVSGTVHISTIYSIGLHELPPYVKEFMQQYPEVNVRVEYRRANLVYDDVLHNATDLGLVAYPERHPQLEIVPFQEDSLVGVVSPEHPLAGRSEVSLEELGAAKMVGFEADIPTRQATDRVFREVGVDIAPAMEFDNVETVKRAAEINAGFALLPRTTVENELHQGLLRAFSVRGADLTRPLAIIHRKDRVLSPPMTRLIDLLTSRDLIGADASTSA